MHRLNDAFYPFLAKGVATLARRACALEFAEAQLHRRRASQIAKLCESRDVMELLGPDVTDTFPESEFNGLSMAGGAPYTPDATT